jgi:hypothetical protein
MLRGWWDRLRHIVTCPVPTELYVPLLALAILLGIRLEPWLLRLLGR